MSKLASKLNKRIMAAVLSVAMVMSNMTVYASELTGPQAENTVDEAVIGAEDTSVTPDDAATSDESSATDAVVDDANGETADTPDDETTGDVTGGDVQTPDTGEEGPSDDDKIDDVITDENPSEDEEEVKEEKDELAAEKPSKTEEAANPSNSYDATKKIDAWDFGAMEVENANNLLTKDMINKWTFTSADDSAYNLEWDMGAGLKLHVAQDGKMRWYYKDAGVGSHQGSMKGEDGTSYDGYFYVNAASPDYWLDIEAEAGDIITIYASYNNGASTVVFAPKEVQTGANGLMNLIVPENAQKLETGKTKLMYPLTFYAAEAGRYVLFSENEKLVAARIVREHTNKVTVSGTVTLPDNAADLGLIFTCKESGEVITAPITDGSYSVELYDQHSYEIVVSDTSYIIEDEAESKLKLAKGAGDTTHDIHIKNVDTYRLSGKIEGLEDGAIEALDLSVKSLDAGTVYVPAVVIDAANNTYTADLEAGIKYELISVDKEGKRVINDYQLKVSDADPNPEIVGPLDADSERDIVYEKKPVWDVTLVPEGLTLAQLEKMGAKITFTNLGLRKDCPDDKGYEYTFDIKAKPTADEAIKLRDGVYSIIVTDCGEYMVSNATNLVINGRAAKKSLKFIIAKATRWDFTKAENYELTGETLSTNDVVKNPCFGLKYTTESNGVWRYHSSGYGSTLKNIDITIPVSGSGKVVVGVGYTWDISSGEGDNKIEELQESDGGNKTITIPYGENAENVVINVGGATTTYIKTIEVFAASEYRDTIKVGYVNGDSVAEGCDYATINEALEEIRAMDRTGENGETKPVTISIQPGNYEEMLVIDVDNVKFVNAAGKDASIELIDAGVNIEENAVRITSYYGHGYNYFSMGADYKWNEDALRINLANGYASTVNPGSGTATGWNATVMISGSNVSAEGIIFENSFNQYVSKKASEDQIVPIKGSAKEPEDAPRADLPEGSTAVQDKTYVERAAALAIGNNCKQISFDNCKFIGRQDTLYGGSSVSAAFYNCSIYGATDYIFGPMTAVFAKCDLVFNTSEDKNDVGHITAAQTTSGRGLLMYNCHVTSTIPGEDTASEKTSKPGTFGRPWAANTGEAVFFYTVIDAADSSWYSQSPSLILPEGWNSGLSGESRLSQEYGTFDYAKDATTAKRATWASGGKGVLADAKLVDGTDITVEAFLGDWNPFEGKDMTIVIPKDEEKFDNTPAPEPNSKTYTFKASDLTAEADQEALKETKLGTEDYFEVVLKTVDSPEEEGKTESGAIVKRKNTSGVYAVQLEKWESSSINFTVEGTANVVINVASTGGSNVSSVAIKNASGETMPNVEGVTTVTGTTGTDLTYKNLPAGTYSITSPYLKGQKRGFRVHTIEVKEFESDSKTYVLEAGKLEAVSASADNDGKELAVGTNNYFKILQTAKSAVQPTSTWDTSASEPDKMSALTPDQIAQVEKGRINFGAKATTTGASIKITTAKPAMVTVYWVAGGADRPMSVFNADGADIKSTGDVKNGYRYVSEHKLETAGDWYIGCQVNGDYIFKVVVEENDIYGPGDGPARAAWDTVDDPVIGELILDEEGNITVPVTANVSYDGGDSISVDMTNAAITDPKKATVTLSSNDKNPLNVIGFKTKSEKAKVTVYWEEGGENNDQISIMNVSGMEVAATKEENLSQGAAVVSVLTLKDTGDYYLGSKTGNNYIYKVVVKDGKKEYVLDAAELAEIDSTEKETVKSVGTGGYFTIYYDKNSKVESSEKSFGEEYTAAKRIAFAGTGGFDKEYVFVFTPTVTGALTFKASLKRSGSADKTATKEYDFKLPLAIPTIMVLDNLGKVADSKPESGSVKIEWTKVSEATGYRVSINGTAITPDFDQDADEFTINSGLTIGQKYTFSVAALRAGKDADGNDTVEVGPADERKKTITAEKDVEWEFVTYGESISTSKNGFKVGEDENGDEIVQVWSTGGSGKLVPASTDGIAFYYTKVPTTKNFKLVADVHVNEWTYSNGQDAFGIMASDRVGEHGNGDRLWNNSYMAVATKVEYHWDRENGKVDPASEDAVSLRLGLGSLERYGVDKDNLAMFNDTKQVNAAMEQYWTAKMDPLDTSIHKGTFNTIGNCAGGLGTIQTVANPMTDLKLMIERNNTGYFVSYIDANGNVITDKNYGTDMLDKLDEENVYVGLFASRNADVTFSNISLTTSNPDDDPAPGEKPVSYVTPDFSITSGSSANSSEYEMIFSANWEGKVTIKDSMGNQIVPGYPKDKNGKDILVDENGEDAYVDGIVKDIRRTDDKGNEVCTLTYNSVKINVPIDPGVNTYKVTFIPTTPDATVKDKDGNEVFEYNPEPNDNYFEFDDNGNRKSLNRGFLELSNYNPQTFTHSVTYKNYGQSGQALYVAPRGSALGTGTKNNPLDVYTAVKYAQPGQTIYLMEGTYDLTKSVRIDRGINGTADKRIYMIPDPEAKSRPVFDFGSKCEGIILAGDYWYLKNFDVTRSISGKDGIRVSGSNNVLERMETYMNGNTGIQISRMYSSDLWDDWPANNLILNCTSYLNTDSGYEDADGFACKLTSGDGNVFDGCIAHHNADDGWDLFSKAESGRIGSVVMRNCIAYKNGYVLTTDGKRFSPLDKNGIETDAGNGNGFKMGGSSMAGGRLGTEGHILQNSLAFYNKAKGIDSNSCPNIKIYNSISYNNEGANIAFYTNAGQDTGYVAKNVISFRTEFMAVEDNLKMATGSNLKNEDNKQPWGDIYNNTSYYWDATSKQSKNKLADAVGTGAFDKNSLSVKKTWFESIDLNKYIKASKVSERKSDGTIDMHGFLVLTTLAPNTFDNAAIGDKLPDADGTGSELPEVPTDVPATDGDIVKGDAPDESEAKVPSEDAKDGEIPLGMWIADIDEDSLVYTGKALQPDVRVYYHETRLVKGKDYTVTYRNNVNAFIKDSDEYPATVGKRSLVPTVTVKGKGSYKGIVEVTFSIKPVPLTLSDDLTVAEKVAASQISPDVIAEPSGRTTRLSVTYNGRKLAENKDYTQTRAGNTITVTAKAGGNYTGTKEVEVVTYSPSAQNLASKFKVDKIPDQQRNWSYSGNDKIGDPQPVELTTKGSNASLKVYAADDRYKESPLVEGVDYELSYMNNYEVGTAVVVIKGIAPKYLGTKEVKFRIVAQPINSLMSQQKLRIVDTAKWPVVSNYDFNTTYAYEGAKVELEDIGVAVNNGKGWELLAKDLDYTITYKNNDKAGKATVAIKGIGNYKGSINNNFTITPFDLSSTDPNVILSIGGSFERKLRNGAWRYTESIETTYTKGGSKPDNIVLKIQDGNGIWNKLVLGKDYTISYKNNASVNAGKTPTIVIKGKGGLKGTLERPFTIVRKDFNDPEAPVTLTVEDVGISGTKGKYVPRFTLTDANGKKLSAGADYDKNNITYVVVDENGTPETRKDGSEWQLTKSELIELKTDEVKYIKITVRAAQNDPKCNYTGELSEIYRVASTKALIKSARVIVNYGEEQVLKNGEPVFKNGQPVMKKKTYFNFDPENSIIFVDPDTELTIQIGSGRTAKTLKYEEDYEFVRGADGRPIYVKNTALGTASVTIKGIGKYTGTKVITFKIGSRDWNLDALAAADANN